jgi:hypothetical protein
MIGVVTLIHPDRVHGLRHQRGHGGKAWEPESSG